MSQQDNIAITQQFGDAINGGQFSRFHDLMPPSVVDYDPAPDQGPGPEGFIGFFETLKTAFPDLNIAMDHMVADDDNVSIAYTVTGTHKGAFMGVPPSGKPISVRGMQVARFENGKIAARWGSSDELGILKQLGAVTVTS